MDDESFDLLRKKQRDTLSSVPGKFVQVEPTGEVPTQEPLARKWGHRAHLSDKAWRDLEVKLTARNACQESSQILGIN
eukprot:5187582-Amphidinium_carterae.1